MSKEAMKLALEALEESLGYVEEEAENAQRMYSQYPTRQARIQGLKDDARKHMDAITALREALASQGEALASEAIEQPANQLDDINVVDIPKIGCVNHECDKCKAQHQEPVAWMYQCSADSSGPVLMQHKREWAESGSGLWTETPLYTSPPAQRKPLTDERIKAIYAEQTGFDLDSSPEALMDFARAIEAAHQIGVEK